MTIRLVGLVCARRGCGRPHWKDGLCVRCWRFAELFGKDPRLLAYVPLGGYEDQRDAVELPWGDWEQEAEGRGIDIIDLLMEKSDAEEEGRPPG